MEPIKETSAGVEAKIIEWFGQFERVHVAFSAGVDSTLVLYLAGLSLGPDRVFAFHGVSASVAAEETKQARELAERFALPLVLFETTEAELPEYRANQGDRCYFCKRNLFENLVVEAKRRGLEVSDSAPILDGANADDLGDHRPGDRAAKEFRVRRPLLELGLNKREVRGLSERYSLPTADKPEMACLASRFPNGTLVTPERLKIVERAEEVLAAEGFLGGRVRVHELGGEKSLLARIEVAESEIGRFASMELRKRIESGVKAAGFNLVTVDLAGYRRGGAWKYTVG